MKEWQGISGTMLKWIAVVTMFIDHFGAAVTARILNQRGYLALLRAADETAMRAWIGTEENYRLYMAYRVMRTIGRFAFPIFAYMLVEGFVHTQSVRKYAVRLGIFALISEVPFDLAFEGKVLEFGYQNIFFTLFLALVTMIFLNAVETKTWNFGSAFLNKAVKYLCLLAVAAVGIGLAILLRTDYGGAGVACILLMYIWRGRKSVELVWGYAAFLFLLGEVAALPAFLLLALYRGKRGAGSKYAFYVFYPAHLLFLYLICVLAGIVVYPAL